MKQVEKPAEKTPPPKKMDSAFEEFRDAESLDNKSEYE
jgi:hypothetical protein